MDDLMYRYNNQNSIYVLNSSFNSYGEFGRLNLIAGPQLNPAITNDDRSANCPESQLSALTNNNNGNNMNNNNGCSSVTRSLQQKLKTLGSSSATEGIGNSGGVSSMSLSSSVSSAGTCSPAAAALQKLFNCTSIASNINSCSNSGNSSSSSSCNMGSNNSSSNIIRDCLSTTETDASRDSGAMLTNNSNNSNNNNSSNNSNGNSNGSSSCGNNNNNKKKCTNVKSTLIAKKTKFLKYLEEEKWRAHDDSIENLSTTNCERNRGDSNNMYLNSTALRGSSTAYNAILTSSTSSTTGGSFHHNNNSSIISSSNHYGSNVAVNTTVATSPSQHQQQQQQQQHQQPHQQYKSNNWSGNHDSNNQKQQKTSSELYKEAAELLGLSCTLCDNCRCLDCQSGYFDCDDSDSYSELSFMDEYDEVGTVPATTSVFMMHADYEYEDEAEQQHKQYTQQQHQQQQQQLDEEHAGPQHFLTCNGIDCNNDNSVKNAGNTTEATTNEATTMVAVAINDALTVNISLTDNEMSNVDRCAGAQDTGMMPPSNSSSITTQPLLTAQALATTAAAAKSTARVQHQLNELEHCASFNELSLMDASRPEKTLDCLWAEQQQHHVACGSK